MSHPVFAQLLLTSIAGTQGLAPLAIDLNRTHATNAEWPAHARFHVVWQALGMALLAMLAEGLIWWRGPMVEERFYFAAALTASPMIVFLLAFASMQLYGGSLRDRNGVPPLRIGTAELDMNAVLVVLAIPLTILAVALYR